MARVRFSVVFLRWALRFPACPLSGPLEVGRGTPRGRPWVALAAGLSPGGSGSLRGRGGRLALRWSARGFGRLGKNFRVLRGRDCWLLDLPNADFVWSGTPPVNRGAVAITSSPLGFYPVSDDSCWASGTRPSCPRLSMLSRRSSTRRSRPTTTATSRGVPPVTNTAVTEEGITTLAH